MKTHSAFKIAFVALLALSFVVFLGKSYETSLRGIDSNIHAKISLDVTSQGPLPQLPIPDPGLKSKVGSASFNDHPFFYFWVNGWIMRAIGPSAWSARILTAASSVGCVILTFLLGATMHSRLFGFLSAVLLLFTRDIILTGATVSLDPPMMFFILLTFLFWQKGKWLWVGLSAGVGLWIKTPVVLLIFPTATLVSQIRGQRKTEFPKILGAAVLALSIGALIWIATGLIGGWDLVKDYWIRQLWGTAVPGRHASSGGDWFMFFRMVKHGFLPGLPFLAIGLMMIVHKRLWNHAIVQMSLVAIGILFICITPMRFRMDYYYNPAFPFLALLSTFSIVSVLKPWENRVYSLSAAFIPLLMAFLLCTPTSFGPEAFVALKRFAPLIQSYGECDDTVLLIPGGEPLGSFHDYSLVLKFYTGRNIEVEGCESLGIAIRNHRPEWIILSRENYERCLTEEEKRTYPTRFAVGSQYLLTHLIPESQMTDLTPLERELKPVVDCRALAYPTDIYHKY